MRAAMVFADVDEVGKPSPANTSYYRIVIPAKYLGRAGHDIHVCHADDLRFSNVPEVVVVERNITTRYIRQLREMGVKRVVGTFDDHYGLMQPTQLAYEYWKVNFEDFKRALGMCDVVIVPSAYLVNDFSRFGNIRLVQNFLDPELWFRPGVRLENQGNIVIGWGGSTGHLESWRHSGVAEAVRAIQKDIPDVLLRVYTGGGEIEDILYGFGVRFERKAWVKFDKWPGHVRSMHVGLAPLSGPYDLRRSNLKALEYSMAGIPFVYSDEAPYKDAGGGLPAKSRKDWEDRLRYAVDLALEKSKSDLSLEAAQDWAIGFMMDRKLSIALYEEVLWG